VVFQRDLLRGRRERRLREEPPRPDDGWPVDLFCFRRRQRVWKVFLVESSNNRPTEWLFFALSQALRQREEALHAF
jgi:hypothetical protein